jgi:hypothetical protein
MIFLSACTSPRRRWLKQMSSTRPLRRAASTIVRPDSAFSAIGFSQSTCRPASRAPIAMGACSVVGVAMLTTSRPPSATRSCQSLNRWSSGMPYSSPRRASWSVSIPAMAASSTPASAAYAFMCC